MTGDEAVEVALDHIRREWRPDWDPVVVRVEDAGDSCPVFYNSRGYVETRSVSQALAGNWPLLVDKKDRTVVLDEVYRCGALGLSEQ